MWELTVCSQDQLSRDPLYANLPAHYQGMCSLPYCFCYVCANLRLTSEADQHLLT